MGLSPAFLLLLAALAATAVASPPPEVAITTGKLRGKWTESLPSRRAIATFEGVPYAQPPIGALRFQPPVPAKPWTGVLAADQPGSICLQRNLFFRIMDLEGSEDCLFLNVYAPQAVTRTTPLPVMVFVHGGGFTSGSGHIYDPEYILERDVLLVTFNYRLGPLGFLSTGDDTLPGNYGMKDMVLALRWVQSNIRAFGGDPDQVTIFGESAGAASVHFLMMSPLAKGLFHGAIAMSGSALAPWAFSDAAHARRQSQTLADVLGCPSRPSAALKDCLLAKSAEDIMDTDHAFTKWLLHPMVPFRVALEPSGPGAFLDNHPAKLVADGSSVSDVPFMTGFVTNEGSIVAISILESPQVTEEFNERFDDVARFVFLSDHLPQDVTRKLAGELRKNYFGDKAIGNDTRWDLIDLFTDSYFSYSTLETVKKQKASAKSPVFFYEVAHLTDRSFAVAFGAKEPSYGVCHADDLMYLFPLKMLFPPFTSAADKAYSSLMVDLFTTFAATGMPTVDGSWEPVQSVDKPEYAFLAEAGPVSMRRDFAPKRMALWPRLSVNVAMNPAPLTRDEL